jgi:hypothetical protein
MVYLEERTCIQDAVSLQDYTPFINGSGNGSGKCTGKALIIPTYLVTLLR